MEMSKKEAYTEPMLVKHEALRDITAGTASMYGGQSMERIIIPTEAL